MRALTDCADSAVMLPMGVAIGAVLLLCRQWGAALAWAVAVLAVWSVTAVLKLIGYVIAAVDPHTVLARIHLVTPSGHAASATVIYGGLAGLALRWPGSVRSRTVIAALVVALAIGVSRVAVGEHSPAETIVGAAVGLLGAVRLSRAVAAPLPAGAAAPVLLTAALLLFHFHGHHSSYENNLQHIAQDAVQLWLTN